MCGGVIADDLRRIFADAEEVADVAVHLDQRARS